ncbi:hypothetical protein DFJ58DRAFT_744158 [Suillus subalutaceus]|uniref:uncharacterized protein n=1 Tax=Suillus subalutaceus TaxID=48586 RepID=UPI001B883A44|nr:uncharacterized protein DFJ58DRAFT_744158 [Suillus subalutaceus]KAG1861748.1 hypothetical protein DFJ58DRAFT_744158 [Suillus subalutaceus]
MSSSTQVPQPSHLDPASIYGAFFIGSILAAVLFGLTNIQAFIYFRTHVGKWTTFYRLVVSLLWTLDAVHLALTVHCVYYYLVINFANFGALTEVVWSFRLQIVFNVLIVYVIHLLYSHRIWIGISSLPMHLGLDTTDAANLVGRHRSIIFRIIPGIVIVLASGVAITLVWAVYNHNPAMGLFLDRWTVYMALGAACFVDIVLTTSLWYLLASSRTGFSQTDCLIARLISYTIDSGCLTSICALASIILCAVMPNNFIFLSVQFLVAKLYVNSYIALLNSGYYTQSDTDTINSFEPQRSSFATSTGLNDLSHEKFQSFQRSMLVHPEVEVVPPTRPLGLVVSRKSILVTVEKESFIDSVDLVYTIPNTYLATKNSTGLRYTARTLRLSEDSVYASLAPPVRVILNLHYRGKPDSNNETF